MQRLLRSIGIAAAVTAALAVGVPAQASNSAAQLPKFDTFTSPPTELGVPTATADWVGNPNTGNPVFQVTTGDNGTPASYAGANIYNTPVNGEAIKDVKAISYDVRGELGAGAPRLSLVLHDGTVLYLSAGYSSVPIGSPQVGWRHFDINDQLGLQANTVWGGGPAVIWDSHGFSYASDPPGLTSKTAWQRIEMAYPEQTIDQIMVVEDENHGTVQFDNLRFDNLAFAKGGVKGATIDSHIAYGVGLAYTAYGTPRTANFDVFQPVSGPVGDELAGYLRYDDGTAFYAASITAVQFGAGDVRLGLTVVASNIFSPGTQLYWEATTTPAVYGSVSGWGDFSVHPTDGPFGVTSGAVVIQ